MTGSGGSPTTLGTWFEKGRGETSGRIEVPNSPRPALLVAGNVETFDFSGSIEETLFVEVGELAAQKITFPDSVFVSPAAATSAEVIARITSELEGAKGVSIFGGGLGIESDDSGSTARIKVTGGTANAILGFSTDEVTGSDVSYKFVLGNVDPIVAQLTMDDYAEIKQVVDLDGVDLVGATIQTRGTPGHTYTDPVGLQVDDDTLFFFPMDRDIKGATNAVASGWDLEGVGEIEATDEDYAPVGHRTKCRLFPPNNPVGSGSAKLIASNTPQYNTATQNRYTLQWWMNLDPTGAYTTSWGVDFPLFKIGGGIKGISQGGGIEVYLLGQAGVGALNWYIAVTHYSATGGSHGTSLVYMIAPQSGWRFWSIVFDATLPAMQELSLYEGAGVLRANNGGLFNDPMEPYPEDWAIEMGDPSFFGMLDQVRLQKTARTQLEIIDDYQACVVDPASYDMEWQMAMRIDGTPYVQRAIGDTENRLWTDFRAPVRRVTSSREVALRLQLAQKV